MTSNEERPEGAQQSTPPDEASDVEIENGYESEPLSPDSVAEDDLAFLQPESRALAGEEDGLAAVEGESPARDTNALVALSEEGTSDAEGITEETEDERSDALGQSVNWSREMSAHRIAVELKRIEGDVRSMLADRDPKRKRRLAGTRRWQELEDDVLSWRGAGRFDDESLNRLRQLIARRHYLFRHLTFVTSTRPTWNT